MLILKRRPKEQILIGKDITITINGIKGGQASIGIEAPHNLNIARAELLTASQIKKPQEMEVNA